MDQIVCMLDGTPGYQPGSDYLLVACPRCQRRCWLGPASENRVNAGSAEFCCVFCMVAEHGPAAMRMSMRSLNPNAKARGNVDVMVTALKKMKQPEFEQLGRDERTSVPVDPQS